METPVHPSEVSFEEGAYLVRLARRSVENYFEKRRPHYPSDAPSKLMRPGATFVTIETFIDHDSRDLRGCIGFFEPIKPLVHAVAEAAVEAAFSDPRFPPLRREEMGTVTFEVSVLSTLEELPSDPEKRLEGIEIGRHGLVAVRGLYRGLLLPQVPVEYGWDAETFLSETCIKAGMKPHCWLDPETRLYRFEARVFREKEPMGEVEERDLVKEYRERWAD